MDIKVPYVDVGNRRFDYSMHYKGIPIKGTFEDGVTNTVHVKKSFGSFVVNQRKNLENFPVPERYAVPADQNIIKGQKIRGGVRDLGIKMAEETAMVLTKGGAVRAGATIKVADKGSAAGDRTGSVTQKEISKVVTSLNSDWVDLFIVDAQDRVLKQLSVNLRTGETTNANIQS